MGLFKDTISFSKGLIVEPEARFRELAGGGTGAAVPAAIYLLALLLSALFMKLKPPDFPAELAKLALPERGFLFYFAAELLMGTVFSALASSLLLFFLRLFGSGRPSLKALFSAAALAALSAAAFYARATPLAPVPAAVIALFAAWIVRREGTTWTRFFLAGLALNLISALAFPAELAAALLRSENLFLAVGAAAGIWSFVLFIKAAKAFTGAAIPRAALALAFSLAFSLLFVSALYGAGIISRELFELLFVL